MSFLTDPEGATKLSGTEIRLSGTEMQEVAHAKRDLTESEQTQFELQYTRMHKNPTTALILSILFGGIGVDRFYIGDTGLGIGKLLTLGGVGIWAFVDWFLIRGATEAKNIETVRAIKGSILATRPT